MDGYFKVADVSLAAYGRKELELAEREMPGKSRKEKPTRHTGQKHNHRTSR